MYLRRIRLAKRFKSFKGLRLIPHFRDFGISSTFDAVLRYLLIFFLRHYGICQYFLRYCGVRHPPVSPSICREYDMFSFERSRVHLVCD